MTRSNISDKVVVITGASSGPGRRGGGVAVAGKEIAAALFGSLPSPPGIA